MAENNKYILAKNFGGLNDDEAYSISLDSSGNVYVTGRYDSPEFDPGTGTNLINNGANDIFVFKLDSNGNPLWAKSLGGSGDDEGYSISVDSGGNVYITGLFTSTDFNPGTGTGNLINNGGVDIFVVKFDPNGNPVWAQRLGGSGAEASNSISVDSNGNVYITGFFTSTDFNPGTGNLPNNGANDIFVSKFDPNGNLLWAQSLGGSGEDSGYDISVDNAGNVYSTGFFASTDFDPGAGTGNLPNNGANDIFVSKFDPNGNLIWAQSLGGSGGDLGYSISVDGSGNVYTTGWFDSTDFNPGTGTGNLPNNGGNDIFVSKFDNNGNPIWTQSWGGSGTEDAEAISVDSSGNVYATGLFDSTDFNPGTGTGNLPNNGGNDIFVSKFDNNGNPIWTQSWGGNGDDHSEAIRVDSAGNVYTSGYFVETVDFDPGTGTANLASNGLRDSFVSKLGIVPFEPLNAGLTGVSFSDGIWGDYDNDGDLDALVAGYDNSLTSFIELYQNNAGSFSAISPVGLFGISQGDIAWGDYDNDGDLDLAATGLSGGPFTGIYRNDNGTFTNINAGLTAFFNSALAWGDYDNDGDLDLIVAGSNGGNPTTQIYRNDGANTFVDIAATIIGLTNGDVAWGDYDNDQDLDLLITGENGGTAFSRIYRNDQGIFTDINANFPNYYDQQVAWGDYDNDGDLDIVATGYESFFNVNILEIYNNNGGTFTTATSFSGTIGDVAWGDYDNDGDLDIVVTNADQSIIYRNEGTNTFTNIGAELAGVDDGSVNWGDYDKDSDLDILLTGTDAGSFPFAEIYTNNTPTPNTLPTSPTNLNTVVTGNTVTFNWDAATDAQTPSTGLNYNLNVGTTPTTFDIVPSMSLLDGTRQVVQLGNTNQNTSWTLNLPYGIYYWTVQSIDTAFAGSPFPTPTALIVSPPTYDFSLVNYLTPEGDITATPNLIEIIRTGDITVAEDITVTATGGTAIAGTDYTTGTFTVSFIPGQTNAFIPIELLGDLTVEPDETIDLAITGFSGLGVVGTQPITSLNLSNDDTEYNFSNINYTTIEGNINNTPNLVEIIRTGDITVAEDITVTATGGTATVGTDYTVGSFLVSFTPGQTNAFVPIEIVGDLIEEADKTVNLQITNFNNNGVAGLTNITTLNLTDDDSSGVTLTQADGNTTVTEDGITDIYSVVLNSVPTQPVTITLTPNNANIDLGLGAGIPITLTFAPDATALTPQTVTVTAINDSIFEGDHITLITHSASSLDPNYNGLIVPFTVEGIFNNNITVNISDNDNFGINITPLNLTTTEAGGTATFDVVLSSQPTAEVSLNLNSSNLNEGSLSTANLTFTPANWNLPQTVTVTGVDDAIVDGDIPYSIITSPAISNDINYNNFDPNDVTVINTDNDLPAVNLSVNPTIVEEANSTLVTVTATASANVTDNQTVDLLITGLGITPDDYLLSNSQIVIAAGTNTGSVSFTIQDDSILEGDETAILELVNPSAGLVLGTSPTTNLTLVDNETIPTYNFSLTNYFTPEGNLPNTPNLVEIIRTGSNIAEEVTVISTGGSATLETDYSLGTWTVNFAEDQTQAFVPIEILGDAIIESDETINLEISALTSIGIPGIQNTATLTIQNDDIPSTINFSQPIYQVNENGTVVNEITLNRTGNLSNSSTVEILLASGTAIAGTDFIETPILVNFAENQASALITIPVLSDSIFEPTETIFLTLTNLSQTTILGSQNTATVEILDNNSLGVGINPTQVSVTEGGETDSYTLRLSSQPNSPVTINFNSDNQIEPISAIIFDSNNWNNPQTATVTAVDDNQIEGNHTTQINPIISSNDSNFLGLTLPSITVNITDNDTAGISISSSVLSVTEAGTTATFTVILTTQPTQPVTLNFNTDNQLQPLTAITFDQANWNQPQIVTVIAEDDNLKEGFHQATISSTVSSQDPNYNQLQTNPIQVEITDNDTAGVSISRNSLDVTEGETTDNYNIVLTTQPTDPVTININTDNQLQTIPTITFNQTNWNQPQQITVAAIDDNQLTGNRTSTITHLANSSDINYNELTISSVSIDITDNDPFPEILINPISVTTTEGGITGNYNIVLTQKPTNPVTINFATGDQLNLISAITFDQNNWNQPQEISVIAVNDAIAESQITNIIRHSITTTDQQYATLTPTNVTAIIQDNDTASVIITETENSTDVSEDNLTDTYTIKLSSQPTSNVTVTVTPDSQVNLSNGANNPIQLTFNPENWEIPQTVTVAAIDDEDIENATHTSTLVHTVRSNDSSYNSQNFSLTVNITENDEPLPPGIAGLQIIQPVRNNHVWEGFGFDPYKIVLTSQPTDDVRITIFYPNQIDSNQAILTFNPDNWNLPQSITLTAVDDELLETDQLPIITHLANSSDSRYQGLTATTSPNIYDNDNLGEIRSLISGDPLGLTANDDKIQGSPADDILYGQDGNDHLVGKNGNDFILGQGGNDGLFGEQGNDLILGGNGIDFISGGQGDDILFGGAGDDRLMGEEGNDQLFGDFGNDRLLGGQGTDSLTGFSGNDAFVISAEQGSFSLTGSDVITDFKLTEDKIELLGNLTFDQLNLTLGNEEFAQHTIIQLKSTGEYLAIVWNLTPDRLESGNFI